MCFTAQSSHGSTILRLLLKFLHTIGAIGLLGAMACLLAMLKVAPPSTALAEYAASRSAMAAIANWIFFPSLGLTLIAGLIALAWTRPYHNAGWAWAKAVSGVLIFESGLVGVVGPIQREAELSAQALAGLADPLKLAPAGAGQGTLWILGAVAVANVVLGIWRPSLIYKVK